MADLLNTLQSRTSSGAVTPVYRPVFYRLPADGQRLKTLLHDQPDLDVHDRIGHQLRELVKLLDPSKRLTDDAIEQAVRDHLGGIPIQAYGCWVHYPWRKTLVHLLDADEFALVRTDRNRNKITREEQQRLGTMKIGVVGLSVGQSVSITMSLERTYGEIRLADFDTLDLSNLNRLRSATSDLGMNKAVITAREIAEIDPFLNVRCFLDGLTADNMDAFFNEGGRLDLLVEECDSVDIKIAARQKARELRIPVVMDMSDRGCLDVERFDLEPDRPLMHGWIDHLDLEAAKKPMTAEEKVPYMLPITGVETLSPRMKASVVELGLTISTWPQLATSVILGGALAGDVIRRILLGEFTTSGRWFVDLEELVADPLENAAVKPVDDEPFRPTRNELALTDKIAGQVDGGALELSDSMFKALVKAGGAAPSMGNRQPWKFMRKGRCLFLFHDQGRSRSFWDPDELMAQLSLGACVENVVLEAQQQGMKVVVSAAPGTKGSRLAAYFHFHDKELPGVEPMIPGELANLIPARCTNRKFGGGGEFPVGALAKLEEAVAPFVGISFHALQDPAGIGELAALHATAKRIRMVNPTSHLEYFGKEVRWSREEAERTGDGLLMDTMEPVPAERAALKMFADPRAAALTDQWGLGNGLGLKEGFLVKTAPTMILLAGAEDGRELRLVAGRAMERLWLLATQLGLSVHPMAEPIQMIHALGHAPEGLREQEREVLKQVDRQFRNIWELDDRQPFCLFRLAPGTQPSARSARLPIHELILPAAVATH